MLYTTTLAISAVVVLVLAALRVGRDEAGCGGEACEEARVLVLPDAARHGADAAAVTIALFVDLESPASRQVFQAVTRAVGRLGATAALQLLHAPCAECRAARVVECAEVLSEGSGVRAAGAVFDMQWQPPAERSLEGLVAAVAPLVPEVGALRRCVEADARVDARLREHAALAARHGLRAAPAGFVISAGDPPRVAPFGPSLTEGELRALVACLVHGRCTEAA